MKKFVSGIIVGALLFAGVSAAADGVGLIGKKVLGTYAIVKDGKKVADAAIINGSAYAPVRAVAEATGAGLTVEGKTIIMASDSSDESTAVPNEVAISRLKLEIEAAKKKVDAAQGGVTNYETTYLPRAEEAYKNYTGTPQESGAKQFLDTLKQQYEQQKAELAEAQKQLNDLEAQLAALQK